jgi:hypothetical protein
MLKFPDCIFFEAYIGILQTSSKVQNDKQIYMELKNMKLEETKRVEVYYE